MASDYAAHPLGETCKNPGWADRWTCPACYSDFPSGTRAGQAKCPECGRLSELYVETQPVSVADLIEWP
jgi:hypothetical protein